MLSLQDSASACCLLHRPCQCACSQDSLTALHQVGVALGRSCLLKLCLCVHMQGCCTASVWVCSGAAASLCIWKVLMRGATRAWLGERAEGSLVCMWKQALSVQTTPGAGVFVKCRLWHRCLCGIVCGRVGTPQVPLECGVSGVRQQKTLLRPSGLRVALGPQEQAARY